VRAVPTIALYALRESLRRRVFSVVSVLTLAFLALYGLGARRAFEEVTALGPEGGEAAQAGVDLSVVVGATLFGLSMFATLFLGTVLAVFLTLGVVRGDAERGLLQPLVVRPVGRAALLVGRWVGAAAVCALYVLAVYGAAMAITHWAGGFTPDRIVTPGLGLAAGVSILAALSLLGSVFLSATANGIAVFMIFGAGLVAGLLGQIGEALRSNTLETVAEVTSWILPFEALYQAGLSAITEDTSGFTRFAVQLGPFGGAQEASPFLWPWALVYLAVVGTAAIVGFGRRDL
jgi:ABC-type transport system involved in multi-copper enzyme maturation permease subunit